MVQGLAFLSKKSWHTKNKANQERVWLAEQKKEQETAKANELAREIQQEREAEELNRIAGKNSIKDRGIDWMYQEGTSTELAKEDAAKQAEEYLLGKEYVGEGATQGDFHDGNQKEGIHSAMSKTEPLGEKAEEPGQQDLNARTDPNSVQYRNEEFRMKVEDPMFFVSQKEREKNNKRSKTEALYNRVVGSVDDDQLSYSDSSSSVGKRRRKKEEKRKEKKHRKKRRKKSSRTSTDFDERENRRHRRKRHHRAHRRSPSRSRSYDRYEELDRNKKRGYDSRSDGSHNSRHKSDDTRKRIYYHQSTRKEKIHNGKKGCYSKRDENGIDDSSFPHATQANDVIPNINSSCKRDMRPGKVSGYGLKGVTKESLSDRDIRPCNDLIEKKKQEQQNQRNRNLRIGRSRKKWTDEERKSALLQMKTDARKRENIMDRQTTHRNENKDAETVSSSKNGASFLNEISTQVNGISSGKHSSLSSRVSQNRHTNQRLHDSFF